MNKNTAVIIPSYNGGTDIINCLNSLKKQDSKNFSVIVVDNASADGSPDKIRKQFPHVILERNKRNLGFAGACNAGLRIALKKKFKASILLNQDTIVEKNFISESDKILKDKRVGLACPKIMFGFTNHVWWVGGKLIRGLDLLTAPTFKVVENIAKNTKDNGAFNKIQESDYITGCAMVIRNEVLNKIGYLDESFFMYCEDMDFSARVKDAGYKLLYFPSTKVHHMVIRGRKRPMKNKLKKARNYLLSTAKYVQLHYTILENILWYIKLPLVMPLEISRSKNME